MSWTGSSRTWSATHVPLTASPRIKALHRRRTLAMAMLLAGVGHSVSADANVVSACSGVSLPKSALTQTIGDVIIPVLAPVESTLGTLTFGTVDLGINTALANAASGAPINLGVRDVDGNTVDLTSDPGRARPHRQRGRTGCHRNRQSRQHISRRFRLGRHRIGSGCIACQ
jgi:hypothetical protein